MLALQPGELEQVHVAWAESLTLCKLSSLYPARKFFRCICVQSQSRPGAFMHVHDGGRNELRSTIREAEQERVGRRLVVIRAGP